MIQFTKAKVLKLGAFSMFTVLTFAQEGDKNVKQKISDENGTLSMITFSEKSTYKSSDSKEIFKNQFNLKEGSDFQKIKTEIDDLGFINEKFQLFHQGIKVEFATYSLHSKAGVLKSMNGEMYSLENVNTTPTLSNAQAFAIALKQTGATAYLWQNEAESNAMNYEKPKGELVLLPLMNVELQKGESNLRLAYKFDIYATAPLSRGDLYIDAVTGEKLFYNATIKHLGAYSNGSKNTTKADQSQHKAAAFVAANAATRYSGTQSIETTLSGSSYILSDATRGNGIQTFNSQRQATYVGVNFTDTNNDWTATEFNNTNKDNGGLDAHWGAEKTYDYFKTVHNRNSFNNAGAIIKSYVHYNLVAAGYPDNNNAFWNGSVMTYGDGGTGVFDILTALDVAGHEIGHAVCSNTANLTYRNESGAMNEAFSDIWGASIEAAYAPTKQTWLIGEDIERRSGSLSLRSMSNPNAEGQPDTYKGTYWYAGTADSGGVHTNSGVLNFWYYVLAVGKAGTNDIGNAYNVTGITIAKAQKIAYRMESVYLTANSTYASARTAGIQSATDLYGAGSAEVIATTNAFYAVGVGTAYSESTDTIAPTAPANLTASATTTTATTLTWSAATDNVGVTGYNIYSGATLLGTSTTTSSNITGLTPATAYSFSIKSKDAAGNLSASSNVVNVTTQANTITYCASTSRSTVDEKISKVVLGTINNISTSTAGYENFTGLSTNLVRSAASTITITPQWTSTVYPEGFAVWIDYNKNGLFTDAGELVFSKAASTATTASGTFTVPSTVTLGSTRMRVSMKYNGIPTSCETLPYGQVEDYTVNITLTAAGISGLAATAPSETGSKFEFVLFPNPVQDVLNVSFDNTTSATFTIINMMGRNVKLGLLSQEGIDVNELTSGVYFIQITDGQNSVTKKFIKQ
jgi:Zn-dependent metalloprotease